MIVVSKVVFALVTHVWFLKRCFYFINMSKNIVFEGWLTKSPPTKRIWRAKWRRRWFALRQSGELPGQYFLDYYADRNCRRRKGTINLDLCEQVDAGLHMERSGTASPKLRGSVFTVRTASRTYHLEADCQADMEKWVDAICRVCGLRAADESDNVIEIYQNNMGSMFSKHESPDGTGPYIPISECITGVRDPQSYDIVTSGKNDEVVTSRQRFNTPKIKIDNVDYSENDSNLSEEDCKSLNNSQTNIGKWSVAKTFTKLAISPRQNGVPDLAGPPVPPRPPKTFALGKDTPKEAFQGPKIQEPTYMEINMPTSWVPHGSVTTSSSPVHLAPTRSRTFKFMDDEFDPKHANNPAMHYCNMVTLPPAVDRALKPRPSSHSVGHINSLFCNHHSRLHHADSEAEVLQYLDLDLDKKKTVAVAVHKKPKNDAVKGKSCNLEVPGSEYKTVDFLKTEAFNITRQDAEALRNTSI